MPYAGRYWLSISGILTLTLTLNGVTTVFREWGRRMKSVPIPEETQSFQHSAVLNPASQEFSHSVSVGLHMRVLPKELPLFSNKIPCSCEG